MFTLRVPPSKLFERISAEAHSPDFLRSAEKLAGCGVSIRLLGELVSGPINNSIRDVAGELDVFGADIPMYRPADMDGGWLNTHTAPKISQIFEARHAKSRVTPGDIVLAIAGTIANVARVPPDIQYANINGSSARIKPRVGLEGYLLAYLLSRPGQLSLLRYAVGSVQRHLNLDDLPNIQVAVPGEAAHRYVGDKVRQAERLRQRSGQLTATARLLVEALLQGQATDADLVAAHEAAERGDRSVGRQLIQKIAASGMHSPTRASSVDALRETRHINRVSTTDLTTLWTSQSYRPDITRALVRIRETNNWRKLGDLCSQPIAQGRTPTYSTDNQGYPCLKTKHVTGVTIDDTEPDYVTNECADELQRFKVTAETVLMNRSGAGSVGRSAVYLSDNAPLTNEHVLHIRVAQPYDPCYISVFLSTWWGERAIEQGITGSTGQLNLANEHVAQVPVLTPLPPAQRFIGNLIRLSHHSIVGARSLTAAAKLLVEALIEGQITEADLVEAQEAIQRGDHSADARLLQRLTVAGLDRTGERPLIPDVNALLRLLKDVEAETAGDQ